MHRKSTVLQVKEGGNTTELDAVLRSHIVKHWKNGKFYVATASITTEYPTQSFEEGGNATEFDAVFRSHQGKHCKNGKSDAVTTEMTT